MSIRRALSIALLLPLLACNGDGDGGSDGDGDDAEPLDCEWLQADNCWRDAVAAVATCTASADPGTLSGDLARCDYADGSAVTFDPALDPATFDSDDGPVFDATLLDETGATCAEVSIAAERWSITVGGDTTSYGEVGSNIEITCPDGTTYRGSGLALFDCLGDAPSLAWSSSQEFGSYSVSMGPSEEPARVFACEEAE